MQADLGGYQACEVRDARSSYVGDAKLDKMLSDAGGQAAVKQAGIDYAGPLAR